MTHLKLCQLQVARLDCMLERTRTSICRSQIATEEEEQKGKWEEKQQQLSAQSERLLSPRVESVD